jgi:hypothetical protein
LLPSRAILILGAPEMGLDDRRPIKYSDVNYSNKTDEIKRNSKQWRTVSPPVIIIIFSWS